MRNRNEFSKLAMNQMRFWMESKALINCDHRARIVHGAAYASFAALSSMLQTHPADELVGFKQFLFGYVEKAVRDSRSALVQFFVDIISALKSGDFGESAQERRRFFRIDEVNTPSPVKSQRQRELEEQSGRKWKSYVLSITLNPVVDKLMAYKRRAGQGIDLNLSDLKTQLSTQPYCVPARNKERRHKMRFAGSRGPQECIRIALDAFPSLGYVEIADEEFEASLSQSDGTSLAPSDWDDPRKGDLFVFVDFLCSDANGQGELNP